MKLVIADVNTAALQQAAEALRAAGIDATPVAADVSQREAVARIKAQADAAGEVAVLMNNAAREGGGGLFADVERWRATIDVNF